MRPRQGRLGMGTWALGLGRQSRPGAPGCGIGWHRVAYPQGGMPSPPPL
jgi:hypothetical protein